MKNPYKRNIALLLLLTLLTLMVLLLDCECKKVCCCRLHLSSIMENIFIGLFSSTTLLLLLEIFNYFSDKELYSYLEGLYFRTIITDVIANSDIVKSEKRTEELSVDQKQQFIERGLWPIPGSRYVEIFPYREIGKDWKINLKYLHHGIYQGTAEYHKYWESNNEKTLVKFTLTLNQSNLTTGSGNYKYLERDDYGVYQFQLNEDDKDEILVSYKNTIPSGLAEGYEKWRRVK